ncbi:MULTISPECIES: ABC transporter substrate-binding protein [Halomonadaceae]|uniref:ABC transporter substrate-binding protein n=1 Tax=Halomonadaceae TaxID=28256 RepID=UPI001598AD5D|nr:MULTISPECIES: ABC transporter substrate-binding protein [Halomonas]QJQ95671.1 ABC transporter substrate-binding protein [Halomonas sp. PA5]
MTMTDKVFCGLSMLALSTTVASAEEVTIQAISGSLGGVPLMIMESEGLDEKHGFQGNFEFLPSSGAFQAFLLGEADISMDEDILGVAIARSEGFNVSAFYPVGNLYLGIVVPGDSPHRTPEDLRGARVGHFGADSGTTTFIRMIVQEIYGFDVMDEYDFTQVGPAALVRLLEAGDVDAIFNFESYVSEAIHATDGRYLLQAHQDYSGHTGGFAPWITNMVAHTDWLQENAELAYAIRNAYEEAVQLMEESDYEILRKDYVRAGLGITSDEVLDVLIDNARNYGYFTTDWSAEKIEAAYDFLDTLAEDGTLISEVPDGVMITLEDDIAPRP